MIINSSVISVLKLKLNSDPRQQTFPDIWEITKYDLMLEPLRNKNHHIFFWSQDTLQDKHCQQKNELCIILFSSITGMDIETSLVFFVPNK